MDFQQPFSSPPPELVLKQRTHWELEREKTRQTILARRRREDVSGTEGSSTTMKFRREVTSKVSRGETPLDPELGGGREATIHGGRDKSLPNRSGTSFGESFRGDGHTTLEESGREKTNWSDWMGRRSKTISVDPDSKAGEGDGDIGTASNHPDKVFSHQF